MAVAEVVKENKSTKNDDMVRMIELLIVLTCQQDCPSRCRLVQRAVPPASSCGRDSAGALRMQDLMLLYTLRSEKLRRNAS